MSPKNSGKNATKASVFLIAAAVAAVSGIHSLGEGWDFGSVAHVGSGQTLTAAFGGLEALASYPLHKFFEASIFAVLYVAYVGRSRVASRKAWHLPLLGLLFGLPSVIGASIGYYFSFDTTFLYAFGVTSALYAALRLVEATNSSFGSESNSVSRLDKRIFIGVALGFMLLYFAALLHG
jgi:zinc transporter ZupT